MKFTQTGTFNKDFLEEMTSLNLMENIHAILLDKLDYFVGFIAKKKSEIIEDYIEKLTQKFQ